MQSACFMHCSNTLSYLVLFYEQVGAVTLSICLILPSSASRAAIDCSLNKLKSAILRAVSKEFVMPSSLVGMVKSRPSSPVGLSVNALLLADASGDRIGYEVPVFWPMNCDTPLGGVAGVEVENIGSGVLRSDRSCNENITMKKQM